MMFLPQTAQLQSKHHKSDSGFGGGLSCGWFFFCMEYYKIALECVFSIPGPKRLKLLNNFVTCLFPFGR